MPEWAGPAEPLRAAGREAPSNAYNGPLMTTGARLPRAEEAEIDLSKFEEYALNSDHETGRHKLRRFSEKLAIEEGDGEYLREQILASLPGAPIASAVEAPPWGVKYEVRLPIHGLNSQTHEIVTAWIVENEGRPRLITAYVP